MNVGREGKRILFTMVGIVLMWSCVELSTSVIHRIFSGAWPSLSKLTERRQNIARRTGSRSAAGKEPRGGLGGRIGTRRLHPYLGYLYQPGEATANLASGRETMTPDCTVNGQGFLGAGDFRGGGGDSFHVLLLGGSVAHQAFCLSANTMRAALSTIPGIKGKKLRLFAIAAGGYKQPQQLIAMAYFHALGGKADLVINLDGYNVMAGKFEGGVTTTHPIYPHAWKSNIANQFGQGILRSLGRIQALKERQGWLARIADPLSFSLAVNIVWARINGSIEANIVRENQALYQLHNGSKYSFEADGPEETFADLRLARAGIWSRSSTALNALARQAGARYLHVLQPNQYVRGSKPLALSEQKVAILQQDGWPDKTDKIESITRSYKLLRQRGEALKAAGVNFLDLSQLFKDQRAPLYIDTCCHMNQRGNDLLARAMTSEVRRMMAPAPR